MRTLDLTDFTATKQFFESEKPQAVILAAAKVGGIWANNTYPADFIRVNLQIELNVIESARLAGVEYLLFLGSSCIYPKLAPQPMKEEHLLTGLLEPTNQPYALAKIAGVELCNSYRRQYGLRSISLMPTNLYGPGDNYDPKESHVLPALICRFHEAKQSGAPSVTIWGTGSPKREFLFVDDLADAVTFILDKDPAEIEQAAPDGLINIGVGEDQSIADLAGLVSKVVGYSGQIIFDPSYPDGTPRKLLDVSRMAALGWKAKTGLEDGIRATYKYVLANGFDRVA